MAEEGAPDSIALKGGRFAFLGRFLGQSQNPLYNNAFLILLASLISAGLGLVFWMIAARVYTDEQVGVATALYSIASLVVTISRLGFENTITRYFPKGDKSKIFSSVVIVTTLTALLVGLVAGSGLLSFLPDLAYIGEYLLMFLLFSVLLSYSILAGSAFYASRNPKLNVALNLIMGSRLVFLFPLVAFGTMGILGSLTAAYAISMICSIPMLYRLGIRLRKVDWSFLKKSFAFSAGNYMSEVFVATPIMIMPSIVLNTLGAADAAFYYIAYSLASILFILPSATTTSLFVEGSHGEDLSTNTKRTLTMTLLLLVPLIVGIYLFGDFVLGLVGKSYSTEGFELMVLFSLSAFFLTITQTFYTICRVRSDVKSLVAMSCLTCVLLIVLSLVFAMQYGLTGLGVGWLIGYGISAGIALLLIKARHLLT